jgi:hypothetical protein
VHDVERDRGAMKLVTKRFARIERAPVENVVFPVVAGDEAQSLFLDDAFNLSGHPLLSLLQPLATPAR